MERNEILQKLSEIFTDSLDTDEPVLLTENTTASEVDGWDSLSHIQLVVAIEKYYGIRFASKEIHSWKSVGELITSIENRIKTA